MNTSTPKPLPITGARLLLTLDLIEALGLTRLTNQARKLNIIGAWRNPFSIFRGRSAQHTFEQLYLGVMHDAGLGALHHVLATTPGVEALTFDFVSIMGACVPQWCTVYQLAPQVLDIVRAIASGELTEAQLAQ